MTARWWTLVPFVVTAGANVILLALGSSVNVVWTGRLVLALAPLLALAGALILAGFSFDYPHEITRYVLHGLAFSLVSDVFFTGWPDLYLAGIVFSTLARGRYAAALQYQELNLWLGAVMYAVATTHMYVMSTVADETVRFMLPVIFLTVYTTLGRGLARPNYTFKPRRVTEFTAAAGVILLTLTDFMIWSNLFMGLIYPQALVSVVYLLGQLGVTLYGTDSAERFQEHLEYMQKVEQHRNQQAKSTPPEGKQGTVNPAYSFEDQQEAIKRRIESHPSLSKHVEQVNISQDESGTVGEVFIALNSTDTPVPEKEIRAIFQEEGIDTVSIRLDYGL